MKLTDSQLVLLNVAAQREDRMVFPLPKALKKFNQATIARVAGGLLKHKLISEKVAIAGSEYWRTDKEGRKFTLLITDAGLEAIRADERSDVPAAVAATDKPPKVQTKTKAARPAVREGSKVAYLVTLLRRKTGATIDEAAKATGWQHHSVRGAISGAIKKKLGLEVTSVVDERRGRTYRIATAA
jgi:hypothetical protein